MNLENYTDGDKLLRDKWFAEGRIVFTSDTRKKINRALKKLTAKQKRAEKGKQQ